ncbi:hypothetical protein [Methanosarcina horonobensis]|uniref:hypothetical protein n=1 Tax=Methanosarcina horonobensis TaxID=418008 RepID=UPI000A729024|nr:hypothetical protein [Methanosarcina horonobensis]
MTFKPSVQACTQKACPSLVSTRFEGRDRRVCQFNGRIPGNLSECPKEEAQ